MSFRHIVTTLLLFLFLTSVWGCAPAAPAEPVVVTVEVPVEKEVEVPAEPVVVTVEVPVEAEPVEEEAAEVLGPVDIQFTGWTYDLEKVMDNLAVYEEWVASEADVPVEASIEWSDSGFGEFDTHVTTANAAGNDGASIAYTSFSEDRKVNVFSMPLSIFFAFCAHIVTQCPQPIQRSLITSDCPSTILIAFAEHVLTQE